MAHQAKTKEDFSLYAVTLPVERVADAADGTPQAHTLREFVIARSTEEAYLLMQEAADVEHPNRDTTLRHLIGATMVPFLASETATH